MLEGLFSFALTKLFSGVSRVWLQPCQRQKLLVTAAAESPVKGSDNSAGETLEIVS